MTLRRPARRLVPYALAAVGMLWIGCGGASGPEEASEAEPAVDDASAAELTAVPVVYQPVVVEEPPPLEPLPLPENLPASVATCAPCHRNEVAEYMGHGMLGAVGPLGVPPEGTVENPHSGVQYTMSTEDGEAILEAVYEDGGKRRQRLVGRIGAGIFDTSWVGEELDIVTGEATGRLFFAPVETLTEHGHVLSPFELEENSAGLDLALTEGCLTCHTTGDLGALSNAAKADEGTSANHVYPSNALGSDAFEVLGGLSCDACHGDARAHLAAMTDLDSELLLDDVGIASLGELPAGLQRDVCARCHLQGDARLDLVSGAPDRDRPLAGQIPVLVPSKPDDDFRFVGQIERLALSPCFKGSPEMTCTTCHEPHTATARQGTIRFDVVCATCHEVCSRSADLTVEEATGSPGRTVAGCVDCHVRRSQPFDLPHLRTADHYIRRRIPPPEDDIPHRQFADPEGPVELFDDGRLAKALATPQGERWLAGVEAMGLLTMGRIEEAGERFARFPAPGSGGARRELAPSVVEALESKSAFHQSRALALLARAQLPRALSAFNDALAIDPLNASALIARAQLRFDTGDVPGALQDTQLVIDKWPRAEQPWVMRASFAERLGRPQLALTAYLAANRIWPSDAERWYKQALLLRAGGDMMRAEEAVERARRLEPSLSLDGAGALADW